MRSTPLKVIRAENLDGFNVLITFSDGTFCNFTAEDFLAIDAGRTKMLANDTVLAGPLE
jgi:hypothetical protein